MWWTGGVLPSKTLLVLGAGASRPYGFPTASELRSLILGESDPETQQFHYRMGFLPPVHSYKEWILDSLAPIFSVPVIEDFQDRFRRSEVVSVDRFLADNEKDEPLGRAFIAAILLRCEKDDSLAGDWYKTLFNHLIDENPHSLEVLSVLTFNYDRSLERYLYRAYMGLHNDDDNAARRLVERVKVIHVYGSLGHLFVPPSLPFPEIPYGDYHHIKKATGNFHLIRAHEASSEIKRIQQMISDANRIIFLGFGFDQMNLKAIGMGAITGKRVFASCYKLEKLKMKNAVEITGRGIQWGDRSQNISEFLHDSEVLC
jgi:hypothetical protein